MDLARTFILALFACYCAFIAQPASANQTHTFAVVFGVWALEGEGGESLGFMDVYEVSVDAPGLSGRLFANAGFFDASADMTGNVHINTREAFVFDILFENTQSGARADGRLLLSLKGTDRDRLNGSIEVDNRFLLVTLRRQPGKSVQPQPVQRRTQTQTPQANISVEPETFDLPGTGFTGPAYRLRNVPANRQLRIRTGPDRSTQVVGQMPAAEQEILVLSCTPEIDPVRYDQTSREGKHEMLGGVWCQIQTRSGLRGYVLGRYLDPIL